MSNLPIAGIGSEFAVLIPIIFLMIPIVKMLVSHQQRMAEIIHGTANHQANSEIAQLRQEVYDLKVLIHQQAIALDTATSHRTVPEPQLQSQRREV